MPGAVYGISAAEKKPAGSVGAGSFLRAAGWGTKLFPVFFGRDK